MTRKLIDDELVEEVARALCQEDERNGAAPWDALPILFPRRNPQERYRESAREALAVAVPIIVERAKL